MTIIEHLKAVRYWVTDKVRAACSRLRGQSIKTQDKALATVGGFLTSPLNETEYALLKRVSGIMGTAVAVYITLMAGIATAMVVFGLCLLLSYGLYQVSTQTLEQAQGAK
jgi:hypothetical protein